MNKELLLIVVVVTMLGLSAILRHIVRLIKQAMKLVGWQLNCYMAISNLGDEYVFSIFVGHGTFEWRRLVVFNKPKKILI